MSTSLTATLAAWRAVHEAATKGPWTFEAGHGGEPNQVRAQNDSLMGDAAYYPWAPGVDDMRAIAHYHNTYGALLEVAARILERRAHLVARHGAQEPPHRDGIDARSVLRQMRDEIQAHIDALDKLLAPLTEAAERGA